MTKSGWVLILLAGGCVVAFYEAKVASLERRIVSLENRTLPQEGAEPFVPSRPGAEANAAIDDIDIPSPSAMPVFIEDNEAHPFTDPTKPPRRIKHIRPLKPRRPSTPPPILDAPAGWPPASTAA